MGKNWAKGKGKNSQRKYGKQHRTGNGENITKYKLSRRGTRAKGKNQRWN
jgi:hypothetical protein